MIKPLRHLFTTPDLAANSEIAAFNGSETVTWAQLWLRIAEWETLLADIKGETVALYHRDTVEFTAALFALWRIGKRALIPANNLPGACQSLAEQTPHFAGDFALPGSLRPPSAQQLKSPSMAPCKLPDEHQIALILFTSGSTSQPLPIAKSFVQLEAELRTLETQWGEQIVGTRITSTVSHHHIYGLLFRLLWPLCTGRAFITQERDYWEELLKDALTQAPLVIVSSPAHLSRIPPLNWPNTHVIKAIFCSGAPLSTAAAIAAKAQLGRRITEIYGSTETGGIAWREQDHNSSWVCLPGVDINLTQPDSLLQVRSAHLPDHNWYTSADRATLNDDGGFNLCGRADRIAKIGGKRVSLNAIERLLEQQDGVAQARVVVLPERGERLGALVVLDNYGNKRLVDEGKSAINQQLKRALEQEIERIAIPRYWRYVGELPQNQQGKTTQADLQALFKNVPSPRLPSVLSQNNHHNTTVIDIYIPANLYYFDGHFPGRPVLPGIVQTHWAVHFGRERWGNLGEFAGLEAVKFQQVITPNQSVQLRLEYAPDKGKLYFSYASNHARFASGRVLFKRESGHVT